MFKKQKGRNLNSLYRLSLILDAGASSIARQSAQSRMEPRHIPVAKTNIHCRLGETHGRLDYSRRANSDRSRASQDLVPIFNRIFGPKHYALTPVAAVSFHDIIEIDLEQLLILGQTQHKSMDPSTLRNSTGSAPSASQPISPIAVRFHPLGVGR